MTKPVVGDVIRNIAGDSADACHTNERMFREAFEDIYDGDHDYTRAFQIFNELRGRNFELFAINERIVRGEVTEAETLAMQLAAAPKGQSK